MSEEFQSLLQFPCDFSLKIIGVKSDIFLADVTAVILRHYPETSFANIVCKNSQQGNYIAITATVHAQDKPTLDALYSELTGLPQIKMVL